MHPEAMEWASRFSTGELIHVLDIGGRDINGTPKALWPNATYTVLDIRPGLGVDIAADAATWIPDREYDLIVAMEVFEHTASWPAICATALKACRTGGMFIATMAGPGRPAHSAVDGLFSLHPGEHYESVAADELERVLLDVGWRDVIVDSQQSPADTRAVATK